MRLLTPSEAQRRTRSDDALNAVRGKELSDVVAEKHVELARLEEAGATFLASQRARWAIEEQEHAVRAAEMRAEIENLETRRGNALLPIEALEKRAENKMQEAETVLARANEKEKSNDILASTLETRLDDVADRESASADTIKQLDRRERGISLQEKTTKKRAEEISEAAKRFLKHAEEREKDLKMRETGVQLAEENLKIQAEAQQKRSVELDYREQNLISRYEDLAQAEAYIKKQHGK